MTFQTPQDPQRANYAWMLWMEGIVHMGLFYHRGGRAEDLIAGMLACGIATSTMDEDSPMGSCVFKAMGVAVQDVVDPATGKRDCDAVLREWMHRAGRVVGNGKDTQC